MTGKAQLVIFLLLSLLAFLPNSELFVKSIFAASLSFSRQEIRDDIEDWISTATGKSILDAAKGDQMADISSVDYTSNGEVLNVTFWLFSPLYSNSLKNLDISYVMLIDSDMNKGTGIEGGDYKIEIKWNNITNQWTREFSELESYDPKTGAIENRLLSNVLLDSENFTGFAENRKRYVSSSLDLSAIGFSDSYRVLFYTAQKQNSILDFTNWVQIPSIQYETSTTPNPITLSLDEKEKRVNLQVMPVGGFSEEGFGFNITQVTAPSTNIDVNIMGAEAKSFYNSDPQTILIRVNDEVRPGKYIIPILAEISTNLTYPAPVEIGNTLISTHGIRTFDDSIVLTIQPPVPLFDKFLNLLSGVFNPVTGAYTAISTIINGILGWKIWKGKREDEVDKVSRQHKNADYSVGSPIR